MSILNKALLPVILRVAHATTWAVLKEASTYLCTQSRSHAPGVLAPNRNPEVAAKVTAAAPAAGARLAAGHDGLGQDGSEVYLSVSVNNIYVSFSLSLSLHIYM